MITSLGSQPGTTEQSLDLGAENLGPNPDSLSYQLVGYMTLVKSCTLSWPG